jgi:hypothetical protein
MSDRKQDSRGSGPPKAGSKKSGNPKPHAHAKGAKATASHPKKDKQAVPFQPVLLRPQEPRAKPVEAVIAVPVVEQEQQTQISSKSVKTRSLAPQASSSNATPPNGKNSSISLSHHGKPIGSRDSEPKKAFENERNLKSSAFASSRSNQASNAILSSEPIQDTRPVGQSVNIKPLTSTFSLLSELTQFQVILTEELKSFLDQTQELFPASSSSANPQLQGEVVVIGVLGARNTGKSTLLNALARHASPLFSPPTQSAPTVSAPRPLSILQQLTELNAKSKISVSEPSFAPFTVNSVPELSKTASSGQKSFSIEMTLIRRPNNRIVESSNNLDLQSRVSYSDCYILLEFQCFQTASMLMQSRKSDSAPMDIRNQENNLELLSLHLGLFAASVCNVMISVEDSTCNMASWKYWKTIEMLKWGIPEISDLYHKAPPVATLIPQLKRSFSDARVSSTYEKMMTDIAAKASTKTLKSKKASSSPSKPLQAASSAISSSPDTKNRGRNKKAKKTSLDSVGRGNAGRGPSASDSSALVAEMTQPSSLTLEEQSLKDIDRAIASIGLYSPEQEYLPSLMFAFNKTSVLTSDMSHQKRVQAALGAYFSKSSFLQPESVIAQLPASLPHQNILNTVPFAMIPTSEGFSIGSELNGFEQFVCTVLQLPRPRFRKPLNPREWLSAAICIWEIIKQSPVLAQYQAALKQTSLSVRSAGS